jgi:hypothetical protein
MKNNTRFAAWTGVIVAGLALSVSALARQGGGDVPQNPATNPHAAKPAGPGASDEAGVLKVGGVSMTVPKSWVKEQPSSGMRAAQYKIPDPADDKKPSGIVAYFTNIGGTVDDNINRWVGQISEPAAPPERKEFAAAGALKVFTVSVTGTFTDTMRGGGPAKDTTLLGAVITGGPQGPLFIKATGPKDVMAKQVEAWEKMLKEAK